MINAKAGSALKRNRYVTEIFFWCAAGLGIFILAALAAAFLIPAFASWLPALRGGNVLRMPNTVFNALSFTVRQAAASMLLALAIGIPAAYFTAKKNFPGRRFLLSLAAVPLCIPPLLTALGYVLFFGISGTLNNVLMSLFNLKEPPVTFLYSFSGLVITHGFYNFPIVMKTCSDAWSRLPPHQADAARLLGAGEFRVFRTVTLYQLAPAAVSSGMLVFLYCYFSFVIVLLFGGTGGTTLEVLVYQSARSTLDFTTAAQAALVETAAAAFFAALYTKLELRSGRSNGIYAVPRSMQRTNKFTPAQLLMGLVLFSCIIVFFLCPLFSIAVRAFSDNFASFAAVFSRKSYYYALANSAAAGVCSSFLAVSAACAYVCFRFLHSSGQSSGLPVCSRRRGSLAARVIPLLPLAVSPIMLASGYTSLFRQASFGALVLLQASLFWPFAFRQIQGAADRIPRSMAESAFLMSPNNLYTVFRIILPACLKQILSSLAFCFSISCGDASLPLVLGIPNFETVSLMTYRLAGSYRFSQACACGITLAVLTALPFALSELLSEKEIFDETK